MDSAESTTQALTLSAVFLGWDDVVVVMGFIYGFYGIFKWDFMSFLYGFYGISNELYISVMNDVLVALIWRL